MKIIKLLVVLVSVLISVTTQASVVKTLEVSGTGVYSTQSDTGGDAGAYSYTPTQATLDSSGLLSFTISGNPFSLSLGPLTVKIQGVIGDNGLFTVPQLGYYPLASVVSSYELQYSYGFAAPPAFGAFFQDNFIFSEVCPATNAPAGCGGPVFASLVPVPASMWLFGSGLLGLITATRRRTH